MRSLVSMHRTWFGALGAHQPASQPAEDEEVEEEDLNYLLPNRHTSEAMWCQNEWGNYLLPSRRGPYG